MSGNLLEKELSTRSKKLIFLFTAKNVIFLLRKMTFLSYVCCFSATKKRRLKNAPYFFKVVV